MDKIGIFIPCFINKVEPEIGLKAVEILKKLNINFVIPKNQTCCGQPFFNSGYQNETIPFAKNFIKAFDKLELKNIIILSSSCYGFIKNHYTKLKLKEKYLTKFKEIQNKIIDYYEFLDKHLPQNFEFKNKTEKAYLHPSCHLLREAKVYKNLKNLLSRIDELVLYEEEQPFCCGFGGTFSIKEKEISVEMAKRKFQMAKESNADLMLIPDTSCFIHLDSFQKKNKTELKIKNVIEYLYEKII